jgi:hypothetical protein
MQAAFEGPRGFTAASAEADAELAAIDAYRDAASARLAKPDLLQGIGLWGADPAAVMARATTAFRAATSRDRPRVGVRPVDLGLGDDHRPQPRLAVAGIAGGDPPRRLAGVRWMRDHGVRRRRTLLPDA